MFLQSSPGECHFVLLGCMAGWPSGSGETISWPGSEVPGAPEQVWPLPSRGWYAGLAELIRSWGVGLGEQCGSGVTETELPGFSPTRQGPGAAAQWPGVKEEGMRHTDSGARRDQAHPAVCPDPVPESGADTISLGITAGPCDVVQGDLIPDWGLGKHASCARSRL